MLLVPAFPLVKVEAKRASARFLNKSVDAMDCPRGALDCIVFGVRPEKLGESAFPLSGSYFGFLGVPAQEAGERRALSFVGEEKGR